MGVFQNNTDIVENYIALNKMGLVEFTGNLSSPLTFQTPEENISTESWNVDASTFSPPVTTTMTSSFWLEITVVEEKRLKCFGKAVVIFGFENFKAWDENCEIPYTYSGLALF